MTYFDDIYAMFFAHIVCFAMQVVNALLPDVQARSNIIYLKTALTTFNTLIYTVTLCFVLFNKMA
jgi:hypothetical protein